jgi:hypothetical protein
MRELTDGWMFHFNVLMAIWARHGFPIDLDLVNQLFDNFSRDFCSLCSRGVRSNELKKGLREWWRFAPIFAHELALFHAATRQENPGALSEFLRVVSQHMPLRPETMILFNQIVTDRSDRRRIVESFDLFFFLLIFFFKTKIQK